MRFSPKAIFTALLLLPQCIAVCQAKTDSLLVVSEISIAGNRITNERVIIREIPFQIGDVINPLDIPKLKKEINENLDNIQLFNFVHINAEKYGQNVKWLIEVEERWYLWPVPILEYADRNLSSFLKESDYSRINYGGFVDHKNFRGMRDQLTLRLVLGYRKQISLNYFTHSLDKEKRHGLKSWLSYFTNHEIPYTYSNNKQVYFKSMNGKVRETFHTGIMYQFRPAHNWYHRIALEHERSSVLDTIAALNPLYFGKGNSKYAITDLNYDVFLEKRNSKIFPLSGYFMNLKVGKVGLLPNESVSFWYGHISGGYYIPIAHRVYSGVDVKVQKSSKANLPYYANQAIGYREYIRGYEYYVTHGSDFFINKNSLKFQILQPKVFLIPFIPEGKFQKAHLAIYWSLFADTGMVKPDTSSPATLLEGKFIYGYGSGIYFVAYYDIVFRIEYSLNMLGESGIFVHFGTPFLNN